jgi:eukaryotic-like serine/threonine-protein kinase
VTDESGRAEVYVQPFAGPGPKIPISASGGIQPVWSRNGRELYFRDGDSLMVASIALNHSRVDTPRKLFHMPASIYNLDLNFADYDVAPDGRFIAIRQERDAGDEIHVVLGWVEELKRLLPTK